MHLKKIGLCLTALLSSALFQTQASEFDQYLQSKQIIDTNFKIQQPKQLDELLGVLSAEDSKTLPLEIDHNTIIEQLNLSSKKTELKGMIITPDFAQFEEELGTKEVQKLIKKNLLHNCKVFFEHEYQKNNPYIVELSLSSEKNTYELKITQKDCRE
ncbi:hypothetical protein [Acinetobacter sp.]|jgi:hypothetical protein|uniref:hypothetical protein n=1 Tax=Acinetobacter sp. TaxID=472 RepID=UPI0035AE277D